MHETAGRLVSARLAEREWAEVHRTGAPLSCPGCGGRMVAVQSSMRFFRHYAANDACGDGADGVSPEHLAAQVVIADAVDEIAGWSAGFEVAGPGYRADVMATGPLGRRIAFEVQRSTIAAAVAVERTRRHQADGVALTVWVDLSYAVRASLRAVPTVSTLRRQPGMARAAGVPLTPLSALTALTALTQSVCTGSLSWSPYDAPRTGGHWLNERDRLALALRKKLKRQPTRDELDIAEYRAAQRAKPW